MHCRSSNPDCPGCPLLAVCAWAADDWPSPDPAERAQRQSRFGGSDRQGRGRLVDALRRGPLRVSELAVASGWVDEPNRARSVANGLVREGLAAWSDDQLWLP